MSSIYYNFPGGKEEIVAEAVRFAGQRMAERIRSKPTLIQSTIERAIILSRTFHGGDTLRRTAEEPGRPTMLARPRIIPRTS